VSILAIPEASFYFDSTTVILLVFTLSFYFGATMHDKAVQDQQQQQKI